MTRRLRRLDYDLRPGEALVWLVAAVALFLLLQFAWAVWDFLSWLLGS